MTQGGLLIFDYLYWLAIIHGVEVAKLYLF
jgi:hypothetical protein